MSQTLTYLIGKQFYLGLVVGIILAIWGGSNFARYAVRTPDIQLTNLKLQGLDGQEISLDSLKGTPVILYFWATWAKKPLEGLAALERVESQLTAEGVKVIAISDEGIDYLEAFVNKNATNLLVAKSLTPLAALGLKALPTSYLLDKEGRVVAGYLGTKAWDADGLVEKVRLVLGHK